MKEGSSFILDLFETCSDQVHEFIHLIRTSLSSLEQVTDKVITKRGSGGYKKGLN